MPFRFGELCVQGDHACQQGDLIALVHIAQRLVEQVSEPLHCELEPLVDRCAHRAHATQAWTELKQRLVRS